MAPTSGAPASNQGRLGEGTFLAPAAAVFHQSGDAVGTERFPEGGDERAIFLIFREFSRRTQRRGARIDVTKEARTAPGTI
jgi:hypothetical protein